MTPKKRRRLYFATALVAATGWLRGRIARRSGGAGVWRAIHLLGYGGWLAAMLHGLTAGSDSTTSWARVIYVGCLAAVVGSLTVRIGALLRPAALVRAGNRPSPRVSPPPAPTRIQVGR